MKATLALWRVRARRWWIRLTHPDRARFDELAEIERDSLYRGELFCEGDAWCREPATVKRGDGRYACDGHR